MRSHLSSSLAVLVACLPASACAAQESEGEPAAGQEREAPATAPFTDQVRQRVEAGGATMQSFACPVRGPLETGDIVECSGEDAEGATRRATVRIVENGAAQLRSVSTPVTDAAGDLAPVTAACRTLLDAYNREDWDALLRPEDADDPNARARLRELRAATGSVDADAVPHSFTVRGPVGQLEYTLEGTGGPYEFRCGFPLQQGPGGVSDWVIAAPRGAPHGTPLLLADMRRQLSGLLEREVQRVELPAERLRRVGDWAEARVFFDEGEDPITVGVMVTGPDDDFEGADFGVTHLALEEVISLNYAHVDSVSCPESVLPDGGEGVCRVRFAGGQERILWAKRDGVEYTIAAPPFATGIDTRDAAAVETALQEGLAARLGVGVDGVRCDPRGPYGPRAELECEARLESGEAVTAVAFVTADRLSPALVTREAASLDPAIRAALEAPCRAWLRAYERKAWDAMVAELAPELREESDASSMERLAAGVGELESWTLESHSLRGDLRHELEYALQTGQGSWTFRCALSLAGGDQPPIEGFHLQPASGSPTAVEALRGTAVRAFSRIAGEPVQRIELPFDELQEWRAVREGAVWLEDERRLAVRVERTGRADDLSGLDYGFHVVDLPFVLRRTFAQRSQEVASVDCPQQVVPDGEQATCRVTLADGGTVEVTAQRRGSRYELRTDVEE